VTDTNVNLGDLPITTWVATPVNVWTLVNVPLAALDATIPSRNIGGFQLQVGASPMSFRVDNVQFTN